MSLHSLEAKVVVLGSQGVGKTSLVIRYVSNTYNKHVSPTVGASFFTCRMNVDGQKMKLQIWDTAGQERFRSMAPMYYRKANAALVVYDITSEESFDGMKKWVLVPDFPRFSELKKNVDTRLVLVVLGNKADLKEERDVPMNDALEYAASIGAKYFETSAVSNEGIDDVFVHVAHSLVKAETRSDGQYMESDSFTVHNNPVQQQQGTTLTADTQHSSRCCTW